MRLLLLLLAQILFYGINTTSLTSTNVFRFESISVLEEPPIGTLILDLASKLNINDLAASDYKFRFYSPHSLTSHYFLIDQLTGHVKTQRSLDREYLCETKVCGSCQTNTNCSLPIEIVLNGRNHEQKFVSFDVVIEDKNEFAPQFPHETIQLNASEGAPANFEIPLEPARDRDSQPVDIIYTLVPVISNHENDESLEIQDNTDYQVQLKKLNSQIRLSTTSSNQLSLIIIEPFDYEVDKEISFKVIASDGLKASNNKRISSPLQQVLSGECLVTLKIIDINDNLPVFDRAEYEYRLDEDKALPGTRLIRVHANDMDDGLNGLVKYSLVDQTFTLTSINQQKFQNLRVKDLFKIDELTGWISVGDDYSLDYELIPTYRLTVKAQDCGLSNSMPVYTNVIIYLNDINDNKPQINLTLPSQSVEDVNFDLYLENNKIELSEWTIPNSFLAQISVIDSDSGLNGKVKLDLKQFKIRTGHHHHQTNNLEESQDFVLVHLFNNIYSLMTKQKLDREMYDKYLIDIIATDHGQPMSLQTIYNLEIKVKDENDNVPNFLEKVYEFDIMEFADDKVESDDWINIGHVKAVDFDLNENAEIKYGLELLQSNLNKENFQIDLQSGFIQAKKKALDRELFERYELKISATDNPNSSKKSNTAYTHVYINLLDLNDNAPNFEKSVYKFELKENSVTKRFGKVKAIDLDKPNTTYSEVKYDIISNEEIHDTFKIDPINGDLIQVKPLDYEINKYYEFTVIAYDNLNVSGNSLSSKCLIRIDVIDLNDNAPSFTLPVSPDKPIIINLNIPETNSNTNLITSFKINATDLDSHENGKLIFKIEKQIRLKQKSEERLNGNFKQHQYFNIFECDSLTGQITLKHSDLMPYHGHHQSLDSTEIQHILGIYALVIKVTDSPKDSNSMLSSRAIVFIHLAKHNSNNKTMSQLKLLKRLINETTVINQDIDISLNKIIYAYSYAISNGKVLGSSAISSITANKNSFLQLKNELLNLVFNTKNYKYFLVFIVTACLMICFIITSLCLTVYFYKQRNKDKTKAAKKYKKRINSSDIYNFTNEKSNFNNEFKRLSPDMEKNNRNSSSSSNSSAASTTSSSSLTKTTNSSASATGPSNNQTNRNHLATTSVSSVSPASTNKSSELNNSVNNQKFFTTNYESLQLNYSSINSSNANTLDRPKQINIPNLKSTNFIYADEPNYSSVFKNKSIDFSKKNQAGTLFKSNNPKSTQIPNVQIQANNGLITTDDEAEAERAILIVNTNSPNDTNNCSSTHSSRSSTTSTSNALLNNTDTTSNNTSFTNSNVNKHFNNTNKITKTTPKKIVASAESLSSVNTISQPVSSFKQQNIQKECIVISPTSSRASTSSQSNFKTFKTIAITSNNSPNHQSPNNSPFVKKQQADYSTLSYRTMPSYGLQQPTGTLNTRSNQAKITNNFDQKPLNLPVNELFKRYELKRHAADSTIATNVIGSISSIHSSLGSLQLNQFQNNQIFKKINNNELHNPTSPLINVNKVN